MKAYTVEKFFDIYNKRYEEEEQKPYKELGYIKPNTVNEGYHQAMRERAFQILDKAPVGKRFRITKFVYDNNTSVKFLNKYMKEWEEARGMKYSNKRGVKGGTLIEKREEGKTC